MIWVAYFSVLLLFSGLALYLQRRNRHDVVVSNFEAPVKIDRSDFAKVHAEFLVVVFTSATCNSCANILTKAKVLQSDVVDVIEVDYTVESGKQLHTKYEIEAVPTLVICDRSGIVHKAHIGPVSATDLWADLAKIRGAQIEDCAGH